MDMQASILSTLSDKDLLTDRVARAIAAARRNNIKVIYVVVSFRPGTPEINKNNKIFLAAKDRWSGGNPEEMMRIDPALLPNDDDIIVTKPRISAFTGSDLEVILRANDIQHILLTGVATSGVVLSTLREAADKDYRISVLSDCCADGDEEVHRVLIVKVFPRQAEVLGVDDWIKDL